MAAGRLTFYIMEPIPELVERLTKLRRQNRNYQPAKADIYRQSLTIGLRILISEETKDLEEAAREKAQAEEAKKALGKRRK